ncbi:MAG: Lrp/AsnC family transcriptional regulator [Thaumarchaeota archaeon]|nr:MAG: Lrp/AsnC family transcriptional regulator [Nitrososphaerota archaeon]TLX95732.1 MAG: Lrp/AsnC family transcriptional regulator [Nitrososphaerota archaeon]
MIAYIFATCIPGQEQEAISKIKKLQNVVEVNGIMGRYDIFVKVSAKNDIDLHSTITSIRDVSAITSTATFAAIKGQGGSIDQEK